MLVEIEIPKGSSPFVVQASLSLLEAVVQINLDIMDRQEVPKLYETRVLYRQEPRDGKERFDNCLKVLSRGNGDCDDLACWRAAELRRAGESAARVIVVWPEGKRTYHVMVERADGTNEDPCQTMLRQEKAAREARKAPRLGCCIGKLVIGRPRIALR